MRICIGISYACNEKSRLTTYRTSIAVIDGKGEPRKEWYYNATLPRRAIAVGTNDSMNYCIANFVLDLHVVDDGAGGTNGKSRFRKDFT